MQAARHRSLSTPSGHPYARDVIEAQAAAGDRGGGMQATVRVEGWEGSADMLSPDGQPAISFGP